MEVEEILKKLQNNSEECIIKNRRRVNDFLFKFINFMGFMMWWFLLTLVAICDRAEIKIFDINQKVDEINNLWLFDIAVKFSIAIFVVGLILCIIGIKRARRKGDEIIKISLMLSEMLATILGIFLLIKII